ncbi:MAG TPA: extracellular solute-binding protein [Burkholderiaceae bacterium]|nr:extracellular solute-binding protein [Burkholderiaceae bacterium]
MKLIRSVSAVMAALALGLGSTAALAGVLNIAFGAEDNSQREAYKTLVADFRAANPDVDVHLVIQDTPTYRKGVAGTLDTDNAPDVFNWFAGDQLRMMAQRGQLDDLSDLWKANTWWNTFPSAAITVSGRQYALPYQYYPWGLFTRRDVLERAGIHEAPHDLSAIMTACSKLRKAGFTPIALGAKDGWALAAWFDFIDMRSNGFEYHQQLLDGKATYNDSNVRRTFAMWKQLIDAKCFDPNALGIDEHAAKADLYAGRAGMILMGTVVSASFPDIVRPVIDYERFPTIDSGQPPSEAAPTDTFQVASRAKNKADARRFLKFASSSAANAKLAKSIGSFPTNKFAPVAGTVLDLSSYKVLTDAKNNLVQGYDRDVPADMAAAGVKGFQEFFARPDQMYAVMNRLDAVRGTAYAEVAETPVAPVKGRKN